MPIGSVSNDVQRASPLTQASEAAGAARSRRGGESAPQAPQESTQVSFSAQAQALAAQASLDPRQEQAATADEDAGAVRAQMLRAYDADA